MSAKCLDAVTKLALPPTQKSILRALAWRADGTFQVKATFKDIRADTGLSNTTVRQETDMLEDLGYLSVVEATRGPGAYIVWDIIVPGRVTIPSSNAETIVPPRDTSLPPLMPPLDVSPPTPPPSLSPPIIPPSRYIWAEILSEIPAYKATVEQEHRTQERMSKAGFTADEIETAAMALVGSKLRDKYVRHDTALYNWVVVARKRDGPAVPTDRVDWEAEKAKYG